jgi:NAD(P)-dependent dehydrogenase (short-subunit alcohol dehydrogenase family)
VALITGGMGGLGESISTKMHAAGYRVVVTHSPGNTRAKDWLGSIARPDASSVPMGSTLLISTHAGSASRE